MIELCLVVAIVLFAGCGSAQTASPSATAKTDVQVTSVVRHTIIVGTRPSGSLVTTVLPDGSREATFEFVENARGPKVTSRVTLAPDRTLATFDATGHDMMGQPEDEHFSLVDGRARWKTTTDSGEREIAGPAFYLPLAWDGNSSALLAEALVAAGGSLPLLPAGQARIERVGEIRVGNAEGESRHLVAWAINGLSRAPEINWLDDAGHWFGRASPEFAVVPAGWETAVETLVEEGKKIQQRWAEALARRLAHRPPAAGLAIRGARVLDVEGKRWLEDHTVLIKGSVISALGPSAKTAIPEGAEVIEATGRALLPGLWEMHAHFSGADGVVYLASGVTTVRDVGNDPDYLDEVKQRFDEGRAIGPHLLRAGFIEGRGEKAAGSKITAATAQEARDAVAEYARRGYEQIKIYNSVNPELVPVITREAHARGLRVSGHVPAGMRAEDAVRAGYDEINHINMVVLNFFIDSTTDTNSLLRLTLPAEKAASLDLASKPVQDFIALLRERKTVVDPTAQAFEMLFLARPGSVSPNVAAIAPRLPANEQRELRRGGLPVPEGKEQLYRDSFAAMLRLVKLLYDSKVPLVAGTDTSALALARELELYVQAGIPPGDVLEIATLGSARVMGKDKAMGSIAPGKDADLMLVDGDPLANIGDVRKVDVVIRGGVRYDAAQLFEAVGVRPWPDAATPKSN